MSRELKSKGARFSREQEKQRDRDHHDVVLKQKDHHHHHPMLKRIATKMVNGSSLWCSRGAGGEDDCATLVKETKEKRKMAKEEKSNKKRKGWKRVGHSALIICRYIGMGVTQVSPPLGYPSPEYYPDDWLSTSYSSRYTYHGAHPYWISSL